MTELNPGDRITVTAVVESAGHDDQHIIVRIGGQPVQVPVPADTGNPLPVAADLAELRKTITAERDRRSEAADGAPNYERQNRYWGWTDALDWVLALLDPEAERLAPESRKD